MARADDHKVIIQISDVHVPGHGKLHDTVDSLANVEQIFAAVEGSGDLPDLVLFTGDLADKGEVEAYLALKKTVEDFAARTAVPVVLMPGNHDERRAFREHLIGWDVNDDNVDQVFWVDGLRVLALDSTVPGSHYGELDDAQLERLDMHLQEVAPLGTILALHHPPITGPSELLNGLILREPERLAKVIMGSDVKMVIAGHAHHVSAGILGGVPVWVATASAYQMDVLAAATTGLRGLPGSAFSRIDVTPEGAVATSISLLAGPAVYEVDFETLRRFMEKGASAEEVEAAFSHSAH